MKKRNYFWGAIFILAAACIILGRFKILGDINVFDIVLSILFVAFIISSIPKRGWFGVTFPLAFLCMIYDDLLKIQFLTPWPVLFAALFGGIGLKLLFPRRKGWRVQIEGDTVDGDWEKKWHRHGVSFSETRSAENGQYIHFENTFGSMVRYVNSEDFCGAQLENSFGNMIVYFDHALVQNGQAYIDVDAYFGSMTIYIPSSWNIINKMDTAFGSAEITGTSRGGGPTVTLTGDCGFGKVTVVFV